MSEKLIPPQEVAKRLGMDWEENKGWIYNHSRAWIESGGKRGIPCMKLGKYYRYRSAGFDEWFEKLERREVEA